MIKPRLDYVLLKIEDKKEKKTESGIYVVKNNTNDNRTQTGEVIAVGEGRILETGEFMPININVGDKVIFNKYAGIEVKHENETYLIVHERDILAIL